MSDPAKTIPFPSTKGNDAPAELEDIDRQILALVGQRLNLLQRGTKSNKDEISLLAKELSLEPRFAERLFALLDRDPNSEPAPNTLLVSRENHPAPTVVRVGKVEIGSGKFVVIAGPCAVESEAQVDACAAELKARGADILRGGCFKARTSPYSFQGLGFKGLALLTKAAGAWDLPIVTEVLSPEQVEEVSRSADILQVGARNMQNFALLRAVGLTRRPVFLKRGMSASIDELLLAAEYVLTQGNPNVILCERGIRTFETSTRNTLDLSAVPVLKRRTHLPIIVDPSHATGDRDLVGPLALASKAVGADGVMVEIHPDPDNALSDGAQALTFGQFDELMRRLQA